MKARPLLHSALRRSGARLALTLCVLCVGLGALAVTREEGRRLVPPSDPVGATATGEAAPGEIRASAASATQPPAIEAGAAGASRTEVIGRCEARGLAPLVAARAAGERGELDQALACAVQASARAPNDPTAHSERAAALVAKGRLHEAQRAYARALALDPDHLDALLGATHLYGVVLPSDGEVDGLAATYAQRGYALSEERGDLALVGAFATLGARVLNELARPDHALRWAARALELEPEDSAAAYEQAVAYFELGHLDAARERFERLTDLLEHAAGAHHHLGLILERQGREEAAHHLVRARLLAPASYSEPLELDDATFEREVHTVLGTLPEEVRSDLARVPLRLQALPLEDELRSATASLSPAILGLYRGPPLGEPCPREVDCRSVSLYWRNLARVARDRAELRAQIRLTLMHEAGHLRGEDELELVARGLE